MGVARTRAMGTSIVASNAGISLSVAGVDGERPVGIGLNRMSCSGSSVRDQVRHKHYLCRTNMPVDIAEQIMSTKRRDIMACKDFRQDRHALTINSA